MKHYVQQTLKYFTDVTKITVICMWNMSEAKIEQEIIVQWLYFVLYLLTRMKLMSSAGNIFRHIMFLIKGTERLQRKS